MIQMDLTNNKLGHYFYITNMMTIAIVQGDDVTDMTRKYKKYDNYCDIWGLK